MLANWVQANPKIQEWMGRLSKRSVRTAESYASQLFQYWKHYLSKSYETLEDWVSKIKEEGRAEDYEIQTKWARDLDFLYTYVSKRTNRPLTTEARGVCLWAVKNYLAFRLGERNLSLP